LLDKFADLFKEQRMRRLLPFFGAFACAAAAIAVPVFAQSVTTNQTMDDCKLIPDDGARLACYDRVIKAGRENVPGSIATSPVPQGASSGGAGGGAAGGVGSTVATGGTVSTPKTAEERREENKKAFGLPTFARDQSKEGREERAIENVKEVTAEIASVGVAGANRLRVTTTDGQVWDQTEGDIARARAGDTLTVKRNFMGGMVCKVGKNRAYRCVRADRPGQS
jgi:hypothetical protein